MTISADPTKIKEIKTNLVSALAEYKGDLVFSVEDSYVGFVKPLKDRKNAAAQNDTGRCKIHPFSRWRTNFPREPLLKRGRGIKNADLWQSID